MLWMLLTLVLAVALAMGVVLYVAFPHRGEELPVMPWVGDAMRRGVHALPTLDRVDHARPAGEPAAR